MLNKIINLLKSKKNATPVPTYTGIHGSIVFGALRQAESGANDFPFSEWHEEDKWIPKGDEGEE